MVHNNNFSPKPISVELNNQLSVDVSCYNLTSKLLCLLQNEKLTTKEKLSLNIANPSNMYQSENIIHGETLSDLTYQAIYQKSHANHTGYLLLLGMSVFLWGDATHTDTAGQFKLELWSFKPLIF